LEKKKRKSPNQGRRKVCVRREGQSSEKKERLTRTISPRPLEARESACWFGELG